MSSQMQYQPEWVREDFVDFIVEKINPVWAWKKVKASRRTCKIIVPADTAVAPLKKEAFF